MVLVLNEYPNGSAGSAAGDRDGRAEAATAAVDMASTSRRERGMTHPEPGNHESKQQSRAYQPWTSFYSRDSWDSWFPDGLEPAAALGAGADAHARGAESVTGSWTGRRRNSMRRSIEPVRAMPIPAMTRGVCHRTRSFSGLYAPPP